MKKLIPLLAFVLVADISHAATASPVLDASIQVAEVLTADNLEATKKAAAALADTARTADQPVIVTHASQIAASRTLTEARVHFKNVSEVIVKLAAGQGGYHIMTCPMVKADWVQNSTKVTNPFMGQAMPECGALKEPKPNVGMSRKGGCCG
jgi:hypothetical protein